MLGTKDLLELRTFQFCTLLESMNLRAHAIAQGPCYLRFNYSAQGGGDGRFIQFSFEQNCFHLDIPCQSLTQAEAAAIKQQRQGFFYVSQGTEFTLHQEDVDGYEPFRAVYFYGDEQSAANDMTYIFYTLWELSIYDLLTVDAAAFSGRHQWEWNVPLALE